MAEDSPNPEGLELSVVIPAYNEEKRLQTTLLSTVEYLRSRSDSFEIIVVDDGSVDQTSQVVREFKQAGYPEVHLLVNPRNRGKGYSVKFGVLNSRGMRVLYADADGATPIVEFERLERAFDLGADIAIGSRALASRETSVTTVWYRKAMGRVFNGIVNIVAVPDVADTQCGFKLFSHDAARYLFSRQSAERFSFDVELLFLAWKAGFKVIEVPVNWTNVPGSKVNLVTDSASMLADVFRFRLRYMLGRYKMVPNPSSSS